MTTDTTALRALIEAVEAGESGMGAHAAVFGTGGSAMDAVDAFDGSLDAAKALHDAMLPEWGYMITSKRSACVSAPDDLHEVGVKGQLGVVEGNPARAWLLAILKAKLGMAK